ncbi:MAG TPA: DUF4199 domain-containing protein [Pyrinomonadaceae bacterium]|nr:DUF4199 domain-containing protein [Pyrinomonadaceae bacterium]
MSNRMEQTWTAGVLYLLTDFFGGYASDRFQLEGPYHRRIGGRIGAGSNRSRDVPRRYLYFASWSMLVSLFVLLLSIVIGTRWYTGRYQEGEISYSQAFVVGIVISVSTGIVYAIYNIISISFFYPHFLDELLRISTERARANQQTPEAIASIRETVTANKIAVGNLIRLSIAGSLLSAFTSLTLKTKRARG